MYRSWIVGVVIVGMLSVSTGFAQEPPAEAQTVSPKLERIGWGLVVVGGLIMIPRGQNYRVLGNQYCVDTYSIDRGRCHTDRAVLQVGAVVVGVGALLAFIGSRKK